VKLKEKLSAKHIRGLALDIDETLSWTIGYWVKEMQVKFGNPENLSVGALITKYRYTQNVPYWQTKEALAWMESSRNSNDLQATLPLIENTNTIVQKINRIVPIVVYLTTRPETFIAGTRKWLREHNFPLVDIIARPPGIPAAEGNHWKATMLEKLYPEVLGIIDDNPAVADNLSNSYKGTVYLYDNTKHHRNDISIIACKTWEDVVKNIKKSATQ